MPWGKYPINDCENNFCVIDSRRGRQRHARGEGGEDARDGTGLPCRSGTMPSRLPIDVDAFVFTFHLVCHEASYRLLGPVAAALCREEQDREASRLHRQQCTVVPVGRIRRSRSIGLNDLVSCVRRDSTRSPRRLGSSESRRRPRVANAAPDVQTSYKWANGMVCIISKSICQLK